MAKHRSAGFTLIELSIAIIIVGLMTTAILDAVKTGMAGRDHKVTMANLHAANLALRSYLAANQAYPCPALRQALKGTPGYGKAPEKCLSEDGPVFSTRPLETIIAHGRDDRLVRIGVLPFRSLGLPDAMAMDGWGSLLQYAVTESLTDPALYDQDNGAIDVIAEDGRSRVVPPASIQYVIFSTGPDRMGGWTATGASTGMACPKGVLETENCDDDAVFMDTESQYAANKALYDDHVTYLQRDSERIPAGGLLIYYAGSCPPGFLPVDTGGLSVGGIETLSKALPGDHQYREDRQSSFDRRQVCYSPQYAGTMMIQMKDPDRAELCPNGWDNIGYRTFGSETGDPFDSIYYQFCAR